MCSQPESVVHSIYTPIKLHECAKSLFRVSFHCNCTLSAPRTRVRVQASHGGGTRNIRIYVSSVAKEGGTQIHTKRDLAK